MRGDGYVGLCAREILTETEIEREGERDGEIGKRRKEGEREKK